MTMPGGAAICHGHHVWSLAYVNQCARCGFIDIGGGRISRLIDASSLGTPEAKSARDSVPDEVARRLVERSRLPLWCPPSPIKDADTYVPDGGGSCVRCGHAEIDHEIQEDSDE